MELSVEIDFRPVRRSLTSLERDQLPFATALTLTQLAGAARDEMVERVLPEVFELRNRHLQRGFRIRAARKTRLESVVFSKDPEILAKQEEGGPVPIRGRYRAVPQRPITQRRTSGGQIPRRLRPPAIFDDGSGRYFVADLDNGKPAIFGFLGRITEDAVPQLLYVLEEDVSLDPALRFAETVRQVVARDAEETFARALQRAVATRRR